MAGMLCAADVTNWEAGDPSPSPCLPAPDLRTTIGLTGEEPGAGCWLSPGSIGSDLGECARSSPLRLGESRLAG